MRNAVSLVRNVMEQPAMKPFWTEELQPGPGIQSADEIDAFLRRHGASGYHLAGSCRMGRDVMSVVDERLRVRGVRGLRIADASVMPTRWMGNTNAATIMIAEKASDMVIEDADE